MTSLQVLERSLGSATSPSTIGFFTLGAMSRPQPSRGSLQASSLASNPEMPRTMTLSITAPPEGPRAPSLEEQLQRLLSACRSAAILVSQPAFRQLTTRVFRSDIPPRYEEIVDFEDDSIIRALVFHTSLQVEEALEEQSRFRRALRAADGVGILADVTVSLKFV